MEYVSTKHTLITSHQNSKVKIKLLQGTITQKA
jgi:hypothetical protein